MKVSILIKQGPVYRTKNTIYNVKIQKSLPHFIAFSQTIQYHYMKAFCTYTLCQNEESLWKE